MVFDSEIQHFTLAFGRTRMISDFYFLCVLVEDSSGRNRVYSSSLQNTVHLTFAFGMTC